MTPRRQSNTVVRYAVVGQGYIAQAAVLPAFAHAKRNSRLVALVSEDATKRRELARKHDAAARIPTRNTIFEIRRPPVRRMPKLVNATPPSG